MRLRSIAQFDRVNTHTMPIFVHLAPEKNVRAIRRGGIRVGEPRVSVPAGVYALPVTPHFVVSHQWIRELRRGGQRVICGVYFRIPDSELVLIGHYNQPHLEVTAARAAAIMMQAQDRLGYEVLVPRKICSFEIHRIRQLPQVIGWRYQPGSNGRPFCGCPVCVWKGEIRSRSKRERWEAQNQ